VSTHHGHEERLPLLDTYTPPAADLDRIGRIALIAGVVGAVATVVFAFVDPAQFFLSYLVAYIWVFGIALGCFGLMALHHLSGGAWGLMIRRVLEAATRTIPLLALLFLPVFFGMKQLYPWARSALEGESFRTLYLTPRGFVVRAIVSFALLSLLALTLSSMSLRQDKTADPSLRRRMQHVASGGAVLYVLLMTICAIDWLMSLSPNWASTIYGFYVIAGQVVAALSFVILIALFLSNRAPLAGRLRPVHFHDYGKLLLAFVMIWAYFAASQLIIIWSGNLPEETTWYMARTSAGWKTFSVLLVFAHFVLPFALLLSRSLKRDRGRLARVAVWMLIVRWLDLYWLAAPALSSDIQFHLVDITAAVALFGIWFFLFIQQLKTRSLLPVHDRFLEEALGHG
jgi:hypothetical protein